MRRILLAGLVLTTALAGCRSGSDGIDAVRAGNERRTVSPVGQTLLDLLDNSRGLTYHATYSVRTDDPQLSSGSFSVEIWRKPPMVRQDTFNNFQGGTARSSEILRADGSRVHCEKIGNDPWACTGVASDVEDDFDNLIGSAAKELEGAIVRQTSERSNGRTNQCFSIRRYGQPSTTACVTEAGIPSRIESAGSSLELTSLQMAASDKDFVAPASPT